MTDIVFPEPIQTGVKVSADILAQKVHGVENVLEIKALRRNFTPTNLTVFARDGRLYSFTLKYTDDAAFLNFRVIPDSAAVSQSTDPVQLSDLPANLPALRATARQLESRNNRRPHPRHNVSLQFTGASYSNDLEWLTFRLTNATAIDIQITAFHMFIHERKKIRRRAIQERQLLPVYADLVQAIPSGKIVACAIAIQPFAFGKGKELICRVSTSLQSLDRPVQLRIHRVQVKSASL